MKENTGMEYEKAFPTKVFYLEEVKDFSVFP